MTPFLELYRNQSIICLQNDLIKIQKYILIKIQKKNIFSLSNIVEWTVVAENEGVNHWLKEI